MTRASRFSPEVRERAVRMVVEHAAAHASQWAATTSSRKIGCAAETYGAGCGRPNVMPATAPA
jgi:transposase-like protein